jgi:hypothetical protein
MLGCLLADNISTVAGEQHHLWRLVDKVHAAEPLLVGLQVLRDVGYVIAVDGVGAAIRRWP